MCCFTNTMFLRWRVLLCFLALISLINVELVNAKRSYGGSSHNYPKSGGLSGGGHHGYPSSGGLSGGSHGYPSSGGSHGYPSSGGSHGYPSSGGSHGYPSSGGSHGYPSSGGLSGGGSGSKHGGTNGHPSSGGNHGYPGTGGMSGNNHGYQPKKPAVYQYNPPQQIRYTPVGGGSPVNYPVYRGSPPTYVYQVKDSGSKYGTLLAGLALLNLGTLAGAAYASSHSGNKYTPKPGEACLFGVKKDNGDYEETKIDCQLMSSFIIKEEAKAPNATNTSITTTTVTNVTMVNTTNGANEITTTSTQAPGNVIYAMLPNGTLVPLNATSANTTANATTPVINANNTITSSVTITTTTTNTTVTNALDVKGKPVAVTPGIISVCWVAGAGVGLLPLFGWHADVDLATTTGCYFVDVMSYNYLLFLYFATIVTPSVLLAAFYAHIYRVVVKQLSEVMTVGSSRGRISGGGTMLRVLGAAQKREVKATQNLAVIVFFFILCWMPLYTVNATKAFMPSLDIPNTLTYFCIIFSHLNSAINPLLYAYHLKDFRAAMKGLLCSMIGRGVPIPTAYRPPVPIRRPALERCNALRERPRIYVHSPVWLHQRENECSIAEENGVAEATVAILPDVEPFLNKVESSSGCYTPDSRDIEADPYLIESNEERCQSPYKKVEELIRRVRSVSGEHS